MQVAGFPSPSATGNEQQQADLITTQVASDVAKDIFLDRLVKEIVEPFRPKKANNDDSYFVMVNGKLRKQRKEGSSKKGGNQADDKKDDDVWNERVRIGTNQCLRILESVISRNTRIDEKSSMDPSLLVMARDIYPPTMLAHAPAIAQKLSIPLLMLPGKASDDIGRALGIKKTSILLFLSSTKTDASHAAVNSFVDFVASQIPTT